MEKTFSPDDTTAVLVEHKQADFYSDAPMTFSPAAVIAAICIVAVLMTAKRVLRRA